MQTNARQFAFGVLKPIQENNMKARVWASIVLALAAMAGGCTNTLHGAGEDIERGGERIQESTR